MNIKTLNEHQEFVFETTKLMLYFAYHKAKEFNAQPISEILTKQTALLQLYGLLEIDEKPIEWNNLLIQSQELSNKPYLCFEKNIIEDNSNWIREIANNSYQESISPPLNYNAGSLKFDAPLECLPKNHCNFHIGNAVMPDSIFSDPQYLKNCFIELMDKSEALYNFDILRTFTWLNDRPRWLSYFPQEWQDNLSEPNLEIHNNFGFWGQIITSRGTLNEKIAQHVRETLTLKYKPRASFCSFKAMREHLSTI